MNIINTIPQTSINSGITTAKSSVSRLIEQDNIKLNSIADNRVDTTSANRPENIRVIKVAPEGLNIAQFGQVSSQNAGKSSSQIRPQEQYQINQQIIERNEIGDLLGIDLFV